VSSDSSRRLNDSIVEVPKDLCMIGATCAFHRMKFSQVSFSETGWPRLEDDEELNMADSVLESDYHVRWKCSG
jgi:hypothetical protein